MDLFIFREKHIPQTECGPLQRVNAQRNLWLVFIGWVGWVMSYANEWEDYSNYFGEGAEISRIWATTHPLVFWQCLETVMAPLGVSFHLLIEDQGLVLSASLSHLIWSVLCCVLGLCHSFKSCALPLSLLLQQWESSNFSTCSPTLIIYLFGYNHSSG